MAAQIDVMEVVFLGTMSGAPPAGGRNQTCTALRMDNAVWLFDCGDGCQGQIQRSKVSAANIKRIFITHLHGDHCFGLPGTICNVAVSTGAHLEREPLVLIGPTGLRDLCRVTLGATYCRLGDFKYQVIELADIPEPAGLPPGYSVQPDALHMNEVPGMVVHPNAAGEWEIPALPGDRGVTVRAVALPHTVPTVGYVVTEGTRPGKLDIARVRPVLQKHGLPPNVLSKLKAGEHIPLPDGGSLAPEDFVGPSPRPRRVVILGDTNGGEAAASAGQGCDLLVHEATNACIEADIRAGFTYARVEEQTVAHGHSTPQMAAQTALAMQAGHLALTHFSPRYKGDTSEEGAAVMEEIVSLARNVFGGPVTAARDFDALLISIGGAVSMSAPAQPR